ncbi:MAG: virulence RhuM family protein [Candidatus Bathyarchaeota archaeon]|nr:virulence RhuM family protein [Candidatus Termiticorpusculum sp.]MCL1970330.1 virulence RhuM family protein [Candidatus Termiticorpusculum sp.]
MTSNKSEIVIYQTEDGQTKIDVYIENETVWLTQAQMTELFQTTKQNISLHINNAFKEGEIDPASVVKEYLTTAPDGKSYSTKHYNLDVIISVGYRVKSLRGTQFRRWALGVLREYLVKGFSMNDDLLKKAGGGNYWLELLERIRDIRSSEKVFYRQVLDLYATSVDYDPRTSVSLEFFKMVQNKIHFAAHGHTAAEVIAKRANAELPFMGLTVFSGVQPTRSEVGIAKNYLTENELAVLNRMVSAFFDLAELRAMQHKPMYMQDWVAELDDFAKRYGKGVLSNAGVISHKEAVEKANVEYEKYRQRTIDELSLVERDFLVGLKGAQKKIEDKNKHSKKVAKMGIS